MKRLFSFLLALLMLVVPAFASEGDEADLAALVNGNLDILFAENTTAASPADGSELLLAWLTEQLGQPATQATAADQTGATLTCHSATGEVTLVAGGKHCTWQNVGSEQGMRIFAMACNEWNVLCGAMNGGDALCISYCHDGMADGGMHVRDAMLASAYAKAMQDRGMHCTGATITEVEHRYCQDPDNCRHHGTGHSGSGNCTYCDGTGHQRGDCSKCGGDGVARCGSCGGDGHRKCSTCHGSGHHSSGHGSHHSSKRCGSCGGDGQRNCGKCGGDGRRNCGTCSGSGSYRKACTHCNGTGKRN